MKALGYCSIFIFPILVVLGFHLGGYYNFLAIIMGYVFVPLGDLASGTSVIRFSPEEEKKESQSAIYQYITYAAAPIIFSLVIWACWVASTHDLLWYEWLGFVLSVALVSGGMGMTVAHEQCHKFNKVDLFLARMILLCTCYMHFMIEHVFGHHAQVATVRDPATARLGQSIYSFYFQSVFGGYRSAWNLEKMRLKTRRLAFWSRHNNMLWYTFLPIVFMTIIGSLFGMKALLFFIAQAVIGFSYLEVINFVEHYGLERRQLANGRYEKVKPFHSWNSDHTLSNFFLFSLPRHSDHHAFATRKYQILRSWEGAPQLPFGYPVMMTLVFFPKLWRLVMDKRVVQARSMLDQILLEEKSSSGQLHGSHSAHS